MKDRCVWHEPRITGYMADHFYAEEQLKKGTKQIQCKECKLWFWPSEFGDPKASK